MTSDVPTVEHFEWFEKRQQMKQAIGKVFDRGGYKATDEELDRIVNVPSIRNVFIVCIYNAERDRGEKSEYLYFKLGEVFDMSRAGPGLHQNCQSRTG